MTNFDNYLNEEEMDYDEKSPKDIAEIIAHSSKKYIKLLKGKKPLQRIMPTQHIIGSKTVRQNRFPKGTPKNLFTYVNKWLKKKGWPQRDKSIMTTNSDRVMKMHGSDPYYVFPMGKSWDYAWVRAGDFNDSEVTTTTDWDVDRLYMLYDIEGNINSDEYLRKGVFGGKGFDYAYGKGHEIWMNPQSYIYISKRIFRTERGKELKKELNKKGINV